MMNTHDAVIRRINELWQERDLTYNGLSYCAGVSQSTIKSIMNGESRNPGIVTLKKICDGLNISLSDFLTRSIFAILSRKSSKQSKSDFARLHL